MGATVAPDQILRELSDLWRSLGKQGQSQSGADVLRACSMTLVVLSEEAEDVAGLGKTIAALMPEHPARTVSIRLRGVSECTLAERVYAQCWMPFGGRQQICCEQIEITASDSSLGDLASVVLPLAVADLPVILWCRTARLVEMPQFGPIAAMAHKVVFDSAGFPDSKAALRRLGDEAARGVILGDLAWTRLTRWRQMLSQLFENRENLARVSRISAVRVAFSGSHQTSAWYLAAWVVNALADAGVRAEASVAEAHDTSLRVQLLGDGFHVELARQDERLVIAVNDLSHCTNLPQPTDCLLMREELGIVRRDPVFTRTLASAAALAYPVDK
jgi:glucose-6-phosphate dehydrogenase assembly protein OpcA